MAETVLGLDFGTTNSLAAYVDVLGDVRSLVHVEDGRPHPSTVWYRAGDVIVGRDARNHLDVEGEAITGSFVISPKRLLRRDSPIDIDGTLRDPRDIAAEVLKYLRKDANSSQRGEQALELTRAVMTIPVDLDGDGRRRLREAARKAGIGVEQFVHEPLAALYGWLRSQPEYAKKLAELEGRRVLVFDWGGGTLDLTLCLVRGRKMIQLANAGDNKVGGDYFDELIRNRIREIHAAQHGIENITQYETPESRTRLLASCERAKIRLSEEESVRVAIPNYLKRDEGRNLLVTVTRDDLENWTRDLIDRGLARIDKLLDDHQLSSREIELCLPTGGMVNVPAVRNGLIQRFGGRVPRLENGDRIIAEGAAWVARDRLRLSLAKPIELLQPDGTFLEIVAENHTLPVENQTIPVLNSQFYCVDPRDGVANFQFVRPRIVGYGARTAPRETYTVLSLKVDPTASPFVERLKISISIDHDYVVHIEGHSSGRNDRATRHIHDLEFALTLPFFDDEDRPKKPITSKHELNGDAEPIFRPKHTKSGVQLRSNVTLSFSDWSNVPGDIIEQWRSHWFDTRSGDCSSRQREERDYYRLCSLCRKGSYEISLYGCAQCNILPKVTAKEADDRPDEPGRISF
ncbi:MAG: Hsp70 family protein [Erythrobacter sp.]